MSEYRSTIVVEAILFANNLHSKDFWGEHPYATHLALTAQIARDLDPNDQLLEAAAWLHDAIEDHPECEEEIKTLFPDIYEDILTVSRRKDETYDDFIDRVIENGTRRAITLKLADMRVNLFNSPSKSLRKRYEKNIVKLEASFEKDNIV